MSASDMMRETKKLIKNEKISKYTQVFSKMLAYIIF